LRKPLDAETQLSHTIRVRVVDSGNPPLEFVRSVSISVRPENEAPEFELRAFAVQDNNVLYYGLEAGTRLFSILIQDPDTAQTGQHVISLSGPQAGYVRAVSGEILLTRATTLDTPNPMAFTVTVTDPDGVAIVQQVSLTMQRPPTGTGDGPVDANAASGSQTESDNMIYIIAGSCVGALIIVGLLYWRYLSKRKAAAFIAKEERAQKRAARTSQPFGFNSSRWFSGDEPNEGQAKEIDVDAGYDRTEFLEMIGVAASLPPELADLGHTEGNTSTGTGGGTAPVFNPMGRRNSVVALVTDGAVLSADTDRQFDLDALVEANIGAFEEDEL
jgi:hypothetical protein